VERRTCNLLIVNEVKIGSGQSAYLLPRPFQDVRKRLLLAPNPWTACVLRARKRARTCLVLPVLENSKTFCNSDGDHNPSSSYRMFSEFMGASDF
jgi:hypothetical protein